jgi:SAM-dependent methyltransferase
MSERPRRLVFGEIAELYEARRPSYPEVLIDDLVAWAAHGVDAPAALEVGAGTGKATVLFADRGLEVLALEPSAEMAQVARRNFAGYENVTIEQTEFERWRPDGRSFRLVYSAQAWHWIAPDVRYTAARAALQDGGALAPFWNVPDWQACELRDEIAEVYRRNDQIGGTYDPLNPASGSRDEDWEGDIAGAAGFDAAEVRRYQWSSDYTSAQYVDLLRTHSVCVVLTDAARQRLLTDIAGAIDAHGGSFRMTFVTLLCLARAT